MQAQLLQDVPELTEAMEMQPQALFSADFLLKAVTQDGENDFWKFAGVASDEETDVEGDGILRKALDLSYAQARGYVNWDHSREPSDQLGFLTKATLITEKNRGELETELGITLSKTATVYVEGELYKDVGKAQEVRDIMKSAVEGPGLGLSLDGVCARDLDKGGIVKAFVRGVAITPVPAQPRTLLRLKKSLQVYESLAELSQLPADLPAAIAAELAVHLKKSLLAEEIQSSEEMDFDAATLWVLKKRPHLTYEVASKVVKYTMSQPKGTE